MNSKQGQEAASDGLGLAAVEDARLSGSRSRSRWSATKVVLTTLIAVVGTVASVVGVIQVLTRDTTNFSHLNISGEAVTGPRTDWAVSADKVDQIPTRENEACGAQQLEWLESNAQPLRRRYLLTVSNKATEGSMLALTSLRSVSEVAAERGEISVLFICDPSGMVGDRVYYGRIDADLPETAARHVQLEFGRPPKSSPEIPITYTLAPGESGQFAIELFSRSPAAGSLMISVLHRDELRDVEIEGSEFNLPSLLFAGDMYLATTTDGIVCRRANAGSLTDCTLLELQAEAAAAQG